MVEETSFMKTSEVAYLQSFTLLLNKFLGRNLLHLLSVDNFFCNYRTKTDLFLNMNFQL